MFVGMWMTKEVKTATVHTPLTTLAKMMADHRIRRVPVVDKDQHVTESDILHASANIFDPGTHGVYITYDNSSGLNAFPMIAEVPYQHQLRVMSFVSLHKHERRCASYKCGYAECHRSHAHRHLDLTIKW